MIYTHGNMLFRLSLAMLGNVSLRSRLEYKTYSRRYLIDRYLLLHLKTSSFRNILSVIYPVRVFLVIVYVLYVNYYR